MFLRASLIDLVLLTLLLGTAHGSEPLPWQRRLHGADAQQAKAFEKQINELEAAGKFADALKPAEKLCALRRRLQGADHWETKDAVRQVATLRAEAALPADKQKRLQQALDLGAKADALQQKGQSRAADPLYRQAIALRHEILGRDDREALSLEVNLASVLHTEAKYTEAEHLVRQAIGILRRTLGSGDPGTALACDNLAYFLLERQRGAEAEPLFREALTVLKPALGPRDSTTLAAMNNLAMCLTSEGRPEEGELLDREVLAARIQTLGPTSAAVGVSYGSLANEAYQEGKFVEAEALNRQAVAILQQALGPENLQSIIGLNNVAYCLVTEGNYAEAEPVYRQVLEMSQRALGPQHPTTGAVLDNLASDLSCQHRLPEAEILYRRALAIREKGTGPRSPATAITCGNLATCLQEEHQVKEAEPLWRRAVDAMRQSLGLNHPTTGLAYNKLAFNLTLQGRYAEAETAYRQALSVLEKVRGPGRPETIVTNADLARALDAEGKHREAEHEWQVAAAGFSSERLHWAATGFDRAAASAELQPAEGLAACQAALGKPLGAWQAAEAGLARGLLDELTGAGSTASNHSLHRQRAARLKQLDKQLLPLLTANKLDAGQRRQRDALLQTRDGIVAEIDREMAAAARREVYPLERIQRQLAPDMALVFWIDVPFGWPAGPGWHWGCVVRHAGTPAWFRLPGSGPNGAWTDEDAELPARLHVALAEQSPQWQSLAQRLEAQRLAPLAPALEAGHGLPAVRQLIAVPARRMAGVPLEVLSDRYRIGYAPSGTVFARLAEVHRPLRQPNLLALGDPTFVQPATPPKPPANGLLLTQVLPGGNAGQAGLHAGDVLLRYGDKSLTTRGDLQTQTGKGTVSAQVWRDGHTKTVQLRRGKLGVAIAAQPAPVALRNQQQWQTLLARTRGSTPVPLPGTRREVQALAELLPSDHAEVLVGSAASEQNLDTLAADGKLKRFRLLHFATHGVIDPMAAGRSALLLANDQLPDAATQAREGKKVYTGRLTVSAIAKWKLDADLVVLSACDTGLGRQGGGDGLLGFSQAFFKAGARSLVLSLWPVDDTATALLMQRFYEDLLGSRPGLSQPLPKAEALAEAKTWLRNLTVDEVQALTARLPALERGLRHKTRPLPARPHPYQEPYYWAAFVLLGDAE